MLSSMPDVATGGRQDAGDSSGSSRDPRDWPTGRLLSAAARRVEHAWDGYLARWHLNHASVSALAIVAARPCSQRELAAALGVTEQTTSRIVTGLARQNYLRREPDARDGRRRLLAATETGRAALRELDRADAIASLVDHGLSPEDEARLRELLLRFL